MAWRGPKGRLGIAGATGGAVSSFNIKGADMRRYEARGVAVVYP